jgi:hypothetical protein
MARVGVERRTVRRRWHKVAAQRTFGIGASELERAVENRALAARRGVAWIQLAWCRHAGRIWTLRAARNGARADLERLLLIIEITSKEVFDDLISQKAESQL